MIEPKEFVDALKGQGTNFFCGVPDSLLKSLCAYITDTSDERNHLITANEGNAIGLAAGHHLATDSIPFVYMQNSGQGNAINPLLSLADEEVYQIPMLLCLGWRGEPGTKDEPQHIKQGKVTLDLFEAMNIPYQVLSKKPEEMLEQIKIAYDSMHERSAPYALVVQKDTFAPYVLKNENVIAGSMSREEALEVIVDHIGGDAIIVSTTGMASRELYEIREKRGEGHQREFLTVGSMGHASQIALGIALQKPDRTVICVDGDGAALMHLGSMAIVAGSRPENYLHIIINNGAHDSVGGQPTVGRTIDLVGLGMSLGYVQAHRARTREQLQEVLSEKGKGPVLIEVLVRPGNRPDLGRPTTTPIENKRAFMHYVAEAKK